MNRWPKPVDTMSETIESVVAAGRPKRRPRQPRPPLLPPIVTKRVRKPRPAPPPTTTTASAGAVSAPIGGHKSGAVADTEFVDLQQLFRSIETVDICVTIDDDNNNTDNQLVPIGANTRPVMDTEAIDYDTTIEISTEYKTPETSGGQRLAAIHAVRIVRCGESSPSEGRRRVIECRVMCADTGCPVCWLAFAVMNPLRSRALTPDTETIDSREYRLRSHASADYTKRAIRLFVDSIERKRGLV